jgi:hypothetical protein
MLPRSWLLALAAAWTQVRILCVCVCVHCVCALCVCTVCVHIYFGKFQRCVWGGGGGVPLHAAKELAAGIGSSMGTGGGLCWGQARSPGGGGVQGGRAEGGGRWRAHGQARASMLCCGLCVYVLSALAAVWHGAHTDMLCVICCGVLCCVPVLQTGPALRTRCLLCAVLPPPPHTHQHRQCCLLCCVLCCAVLPVTSPLPPQS